MLRPGNSAFFLLLASVAGLPPLAAPPASPDPLERIHTELTAAREQTGRQGLQRRPALDRVARERALEIASLPRERRLSGARPLSERIAEHGVKSQRSLERLILLKNVDLFSGVMDQWRGQADAWSTITGSELHGAGYAAVQASDGWTVFVAVMVRDLRIPESAEELERLEMEVFRGINRVREEHRLTPLSLHAALSGVARAHSKDMAENDFFAHGNLSGTRPGGRVKSAGIRFRAVAENLTMNSNPDTPAAQAVRDWMRSPGHRANILDGSYTQTGIGLAVSDDGRYFFTQLFMTPP